MFRRSNDLDFPTSISNIVPTEGITVQNRILNLCHLRIEFHKPTWSIFKFMVALGIVWLQQAIESTRRQSFEDTPCLF